MRAGIGFSWGSGTLTQAGKDYPIKIDGLSLASVGITTASAYGKVYHLKELSDINGTYRVLSESPELQRLLRYLR